MSNVDPRTGFEYNNVCCKCGQAVGLWFHGQGVICKTCEEWGITREEVFPTIADLFSEDKADMARLGAGVVYTDGKKVLLLKRSGESDHPGTWGIPGGHAETGETPLEAAHREAKEETGVSVAGRQFAKFDVRDGGKHFHVFLFAVKSPFDCDLSDEHTAYEWVGLDQLEGYKLHPKLRESLPKYQKAIAEQFGRPKSFSEWLQIKKNG